MEKAPLVSICCITYNHEKYIAQTIEGFLMQQTDFEFEIVIGEDCSTDSTASIIRKYKDQHPKKFNVLYNLNNIGVTPNWKKTLLACKGEFIAICEGDDYWTDPQKLSKQVLFLQNNPDFAICFHDTQILDENTKQFSADKRLQTISNITSIEDLSDGHYIHSHTIMVRNSGLVMNEFNQIHSPIADYPFCMLNAKYGKIMKLDDVMAVYRIHNGGVWSGIDIEKRTIQSVAMLDAMLPYFETIIQNKLMKRKAFILFGLFKHQIDYDEYTKAMEIYDVLVNGAFMKEVKDILFQKINFLQSQVRSYKNSRYFTLKNTLIGKRRNK